MSWVRPLLNFYLRLTEKPYLRKVTDIIAARKSFERKSSLFFYPPKSARFSEDKIDDVPVLWVNEDEAKGPIVLYLHGGAYVFGSSRTHSALVARLMRDTVGAACLPDYRLAPENVFPAALEDAMKLYRSLLESRRLIFIGGDSAGGGLALALLHCICVQGLPQPAGVFAFSPLTDCTFSGDSIKRNAVADVMLPAQRSGDMVRFYLGDHDPLDPGVSPLFGKFDGACPVWLTAGDTEILCDDTTRMAQRLQAQGVRVEVKIERDLPHVWPIFHNILPEGRHTLRVLARWINSLADS
ncbi:MAG: alpha/beta hydrolase, partial [Pseudomonadota bacterium]